MAKLLAKTVLSHQLLKVEKQVLFNVRHLRGVRPEEAKTLKQKLDDLERLRRDPQLFYKVNIGLPHMKQSRSLELQQRIQTLKKLKANPNLIKNANEISLEEIRAEWLKSSGPFHVKTIAEHFNIFEDLFGDAYFVPRISLSIKYREENGDLIPVFHGNQIKPFEAKNVPLVQFEADSSSLWSLLLTNPDGHFTESNAEYVHWFIGNIPGNQVSEGETVVDYLQPFPAKGTGFQRMIFILYKQENKIDFSRYKRQSPCYLLADRTFRTLDFYRDMQDVITPAGLSFFQTDWDPSLTNFFHNILDMKEPIYEYDFPVPYKKPPVWFPKKEAFNLYMDKHRDPKQIAKELLVKHLKTVDPFVPPEREFPFPNALPEDNRLPSWYRVELRKQRLKWGRYSDAYQS